MAAIMVTTTLCYIENDGKYLMLHRVKKHNDINEGKWIGVGGHVEGAETPEECLIREVKEETNLDIIPGQIIHEDSNFDKKKDMIFIRLVYLVTLKSDIDKIKLDEKEHSEYKLIEDISELKDQKLVPFLKKLFKNK